MIKNHLDIIDDSSLANIKSSKEAIKKINNNGIIEKNNNENKAKRNKKIIYKTKSKKKGKKAKKEKSKIIHDENTKNIAILQTQGLNQKNEIESNNKSNELNLNLIKINLNHIEIEAPPCSNYTLNNYTFEEAIKYDLRPLLKINFIFLLSKQTIFHTFLFRSPLEPFSLRLCLLIFILSSDLALNAFFYLDDIISKKYKYAKGLFLFTFSNNLTIVLLSTLIGFVFMALFKKMNNPENNIRDIFIIEEEKIKKNKKYIVTNERKKEIIAQVEEVLKRHKIKVVILIVVEFSMSLFFWYYVTAFCHVYSSTQTSWIFDGFLSVISRIIIEILVCLGLAKLYRMAVASNINCLYKLALLFY